MVEENKKHFNEIASHNHEDPRTAVEMRKKYQFDKNSTVLLDFATNAGLIARELEPYAKKIVGVDISDGPVNIFNEWVAKKGISAEKMHAVAVELEGKEGELDGLKFDVITCGASYHHFEDINKMTKMLTSFLKPNGVLLVVDVTKAGLTSESMEEAFTKAGLTGFNFELFSKVRMLGNESFLFIASGKKE
ncbi:S-adenosyl-L-methionine-dependent methyltransferase [Agrocybe pediades]|nr:S-adenosyl-L-methionine-dependent methyltransferase [Agrocybe pediades]